MVVAYALMGASIFQYIETLEIDPSVQHVEDYRHSTVKKLWNLTRYEYINTLKQRKNAKVLSLLFTNRYFNTLNHDLWERETKTTLFEHEQVSVVRFSCGKP